MFRRLAQMCSPLFPTMVNPTPGHNEADSMESRFTKERLVFLMGPITDRLANSIILQLLYMHFSDPKTPIRMLINSQGGDLLSTVAICNTMRTVNTPIQTCCIAEASSGAALVLAAGSPGQRYSLVNARVMIHQPQIQISNAISVTDATIQLRNINEQKTICNRLLSEFTSQPLSLIEQIVERDRFMSAEEAKKFGIIDHIINNWNQCNTSKRGSQPSSRHIITDAMS